MDAPADPKSPLRLAARRRRDAIDPAWRHEASLRIVRLALTLPEFTAARVIAAYASIGSEVETDDLLAEIVKAKGGVALPLLDPATGRMEHRFLAGTEDRFLRKGSFGIREPDPARCPRQISLSEIDLCLLPGLAFDRRGCRLGMGGGHYDRFLDAVETPPKFGLSFSVQVQDELPKMTHDVQVDGIITEEGILRF